jgi:hypothetical protein
MSRLTVVALMVAGVAAAAAACRGEPKPDRLPESLPGSYVYAASGSVLNKLSWQIEANLNLEPDGTFTLTLDKTVNGEKDSTEKTSGTYSVSGDKLWISEASDRKPYGPRTKHSLTIKPDSLVGEIGWTAHLVLRGIGAPDPVLVKRHPI